MTTFSFASAHSVLENVRSAASEVVDLLKAQLSNPPHLIVFFATDDFIESFSAVANILQRAFPNTIVMGMTAESVLAADCEFENPPAMAAWAACLPGALLTPFALEYAQTPEGDSFLGWPDEIYDQTWSNTAALMMLADPFSFPADVFLQRFSEQRQHTRVFGGMASAGHAPRNNRICMNGETLHSGAAALLIEGEIAIDLHVSQGCRPIGDRYLVTKASSNIIYELGGKPALQRLNELIVSLGEEDRKLVGQGLHIGIAMNEYRDNFGRGDYLIRHVMGVEKSTGALIIGDYPKTGQTVHFHVRDAASSSEDLALSLPLNPPPPNVGALVFTCNGRGSRMFDAPHHDASLVCEKLATKAVAGCFCAGELGPVANKNFLHGFTACTAVFRTAGS